MKKLVRFDWAIKNILRDKANFEILEGFLSELLFEDIKIHRILESEANPNRRVGKYNRVDILVENSKNEYVLVEVQNDTELDFFHRLLYASSKLITEYLDLGQAYSQIKKVISVSIVYFNLGVGKDYIYQGCTTFKGLQQKDELALNPRQKVLFQKETVEDIFPEYYLIKPTSFQNNIQTALDEWVYFFKNSEVKENFTAKGIQKAAEKLKFLAMPLEKQREYKGYLEDLSYEASISETVHFEAQERLKEITQVIREEAEEKGIQKGIEKGIQKGKKEEKLEIAKNALKKGLDLSLIVELTGLSEEEIQKIKNN